MDLICPYKCRGCGKIGVALCDCCIFYISAEFRDFPHKFFDGRLFVGGLREGLLGRCLIEFKYDSVRGLALPLAKILDNVIPRETREVVVVPLPTIRKHIRERGFDHTLLIAKELARMRGWECLPILRRKNDTVQVGADAEKRAKQANEAYEMDLEVLKGAGDRKILLVDDIWTTGASMKAARQTLVSAGVAEERVYMAVLAMNRCIEDDVEVE